MLLSYSHLLICMLSVICSQPDVSITLNFSLKIDEVLSARIDAQAAIHRRSILCWLLAFR